MIVQNAIIAIRYTFTAFRLYSLFYLYLNMKVFFNLLPSLSDFHVFICISSSYCACSEEQKMETFKFANIKLVNIRTDLQQVGCGYMEWIGLAQDRDRWRTLVSAVMNLRVPWNAGNFLTSCKPVSCSRSTLHHGVSNIKLVFKSCGNIFIHTIYVLIVTQDIKKSPLWVTQHFFKIQWNRKLFLTYWSIKFSEIMPDKIKKSSLHNLLCSRITL